MPTFGEEAQGGNSNTDATLCWKTLFTLPVNGTVTEIHAYFRNWNAAAKDASVAIYDGLVRQVELTDAVAGLNNDWWVFDIADTFLVAGVYGLALKDASGANNMSIYYAAGAANQAQVNIIGAGDPCPAPYVIDAQIARKYSIHADYTVVTGLASKRLQVGVGL